MQFFPLQLFSTPCDLGKSSQIMTTGSSHLSSWCFPNPLFKKKSQDIQQDSIWLELSSCQPKLYPPVCPAAAGGGGHLCVIAGNEGK